ncbi:MAG: DUF3857 domain-containing protein [Winogradskyella sp.]
MKLRLLITALFACFFSYSQNYNIGMSVSIEDLKQSTYAKDSTASALVIYDYGNSFIDQQSFWLRVQIKQKVKILKSEGLKKGEIEVKLYKGKSSKEKILNIKGTTHNLENGKIKTSKLLPNAIFKEENENYTLVKFVLPNVKIGSVITYSYETQSRFMTKYQPWYFQGADPVLYSEYNTSIPANYNYHIKLVGKIPLNTNAIKIEKECLKVTNGSMSDCTVSKYVMKNIPAYKPEGFTTTALNYTSRIEYELNEIKNFDGSTNRLSKTWKIVDKELKTDADFGKQLRKKNNLVQNLLPDSISLIDNDLEKAKAIYQFVIDNYRWNNKYERYNVSIKKLIKENVGSAFEINILLENLLSIEGFKTHPILLSTRANGLATKIYPVLTDFNYVILKTTIKDKDYFLDATNPYLAFGELPFRCLNQYGRLMDFENGSNWETIEAKKHSIRTNRIQLIFDTAKNNFEGLVASNHNGYHALSLKQNYDESPTGYKEEIANKYTNIKINEHKIIDFDKRQSEFKEQLNITVAPEFIGDKLFLNPFIFKFFEENPFKLQERTYPIDFGYKDIYFYTMIIELKDGLKVLEIPNAINYALPNKSGSLKFNIESKGNTLTLFFKLKFDKAIYEPEFYSYLKELMNKVVQIQNNTVIVLGKH